VVFAVSESLVRPLRGVAARSRGERCARRLHAFVRDVEPTMDVWSVAIAFLTRDRPDFAPTRGRSTSSFRTCSACRRSC